jgi:hypothetical protein
MLGEAEVVLRRKGCAVTAPGTKWAQFVEWADGTAAWGSGVDCSCRGYYTSGL